MLTKLKNLRFQTFDYFLFTQSRLVPRFGTDFLLFRQHQLVSCFQFIKQAMNAIAQLLNIHLVFTLFKQ
jgi:hypothetical protein